MGNPQIGFRLVVNGKLVRHFPKGQGLAQRAGMLLGKETAACLYPLDHQVPYKEGSLIVSGVCATPAVTRSTAGRLYYFVNARLVKDPGLTAALFQGYRGRIMKGRYPVGVICIDLPFAEVDVNVHPAKREIKFLSPQPVYQALASAVSSAMAEAQTDPVAYSRSGAVQPCENAADLSGSLDVQQRDGPATADTPYCPVSEASGRVAQPGAPWQGLGDDVEKKQTAAGTGGRESFAALTRVSPSEPPPLIRFTTRPRVMGQVLGTYIVAEHEKHLVLVDQHAAHERITYDALKKRHQGLGVQSQDLMVPEVLEVTHREADLLAGILEDLGRLGIRMEPFGGESFVIKSIPVLMEDKAVKPFVADVLDTLAQANEVGEKDGPLDEILISMACHRAIRANKAMTPEEMAQLLSDLWQCENPMHCPHGRPIMISFDAGQLEKLFKRVV